jgi:hypothetical protein
MIRITQARSAKQIGAARTLLQAYADALPSFTLADGVCP